jgi:vancomycin resistance protein YoaR
MTEIAARLARPVHRLGLASTVAIAFALVLLVLGALVTARGIMLRNAVLPGTQVAGVDVGGLSPVQAEARIATELGARLARPVEVSLDRRTVTAHPDELFVLDSSATAAAAFDSARESLPAGLAALAVPFIVKRDVAPVIEVRPTARNALLAELRTVLAQPRSARLELRGSTPVVTPGREGEGVDEAAFLEALEAAAFGGLGVLDVQVVAVEPAITTTEAEAVAAQARTALSEPVELEARRKSVGKLGPGRMAALLRVERTAGSYRLAVDPRTLRRQVGPLVDGYTREARDASFRVKGKRVRVVPDKPGKGLAVEQTGASVLAAALAPSDRTAAVSFERVQARFTTREAKALGIRHRVSTYTTLMGESSANRIWNVQLLGRYLDGTILKPGEVFSYNKVMGPRTEERGFREGQMIFGGVLIPSIGGGVCQTATTIFNAAFEAGMPILKRTNHSFYISHYPTGRDATVSWGGSDFVFKNDLDHAILIKAHGDADTFTVTFYGTKQGRRVVSSTSTPTNYTQPRLQYAVDPSAPPGSVRTAEGGGPGFHVNVHRKVYERGRLIREDDFPTTYTPQNPTRIYGPGTTPPGPYFVLPSGA